MMLWDWLRDALRFRRSPPPIEALIARDVSQRLSQRADELTKHLQKYHRANDPFAAFMADLYNRDQLSKIHRGPDR